MGESVIRVLIWTTLFVAFGLSLLAWIRYRQGGLHSAAKGKGLGVLFAFRGQTLEDDKIKLLSSKRIAQGQMVIAIQWQGREFLLGATPHAISVLAEQGMKEGP